MRLVAKPEFETKKVPISVAFRSAEKLAMPNAWVLRHHDAAVVQRLQEHGLLVRRLKEATRVAAEVFVISNVERARRPFQGHREVSVKGRYEQREVELPAGALVVDAKWLLVRVAAQLLEPVSEDSLTTWNFFDAWLPAASADREPTADDLHPVVRILGAVELSTEPIAPAATTGR
jgi:hypothetical protein